MLELFRGPDIRRTAVLTILVCALSLTAHWAFMFWYAQQLRNLPDVVGWTKSQRQMLVSAAVCAVDGGIDRRQFRRGVAGAAAGLSLGDLDACAWPISSRCSAPTSSRATIARCGSGLGDRRGVPGSVRPVHNVPAAAVPDAAAHHRGRLLLQHRPAGGCGWAPWPLG